MNRGFVRKLCLSFLLIAPAFAEEQAEPLLQILAPKDGRETAEAVVHILGRTAPGNRAEINDQPVEVFSTGAFVRDGMPLSPGKNTIRVKITDTAGRSQSRELTVIRTESRVTTSQAAEKEFRVVEPSEDLALREGDLLTIRVTGPSGAAGEASLAGMSRKLPLTEIKDQQGSPTGVYTASARVGDGKAAKAAPVVVRMKPAGGAAVEIRSRTSVQVWDSAVPRVGEAQEDDLSVVYGLHTVRLGGPYLTRLPKGTRFEILGAQGRNLRIALSRTLSGWVSGRHVAQLAEGTPVPHAFFTACSIDGDDQYDRLSVGLSEKVAFSVHSDTEPSNRLYVDIFNAHHALTWISHKSGARVIGAVTCEQIEDDRVRLTVPLRCRQNWGYWTETRGNTLTVYVRRPPKIAASPDSPLKGLLFALEAGHGGEGSGARGHMGTLEKDINAAAVLALQKVLESRGARTVQVRPGDTSPSLQERVDRTNEAKADFYVSIHANAAGNSRGYLSVSGTSTYYLEKHCHIPADRVYRKLLELGWQEFGVVGNFSYYPLQNTRTPGILVEQAFMSNPYDEARMLDAEYQRKQAQAITAGLEEFFAGARE